jgi:hypothetical protein
MPYMPPGWQPWGVSTTADTYRDGNLTKCAWRRMNSVGTMRSTVTTVPRRAAMAP